MAKLIMVSNRLPVVFGADGTATRTAGGLVYALQGADLDCEQVWVGWTGAADEDLESPDVVRASARREGFVPVFLTRDDVAGFYEGYANATLWPLLHYMVERATFSNDWWDAYQRVNRKFADTITEVADEGDLV